jgi:hypothetical protein
MICSNDAIVCLHVIHLITAITGTDEGFSLSLEQQMFTDFQKVLDINR